MTGLVKHSRGRAINCGCFKQRNHQTENQSSQNTYFTSYDASCVQLLYPQQGIGIRVDEESAGRGFPKPLQPAKDGSQVWPDLHCSDGLLMKMTMIGWPGEVQAEANAVSTAPTLGEHTHLVVAKWQFVRTASPVSRLLRLPLTLCHCLSREHRPMY